MTRTIVFSDCGQLAAGPSGVDSPVEHAAKARADFAAAGEEMQRGIDVGICRRRTSDPSMPSSDTVAAMTMFR